VYRVFDLIFYLHNNNNNNNNNNSLAVAEKEPIVRHCLE